jgi:hypothetical protein
MSKKAVIEEIHKKLTKLGISRDMCRNIDTELPNGNNLNWVSHTQVMISVKIKSLSSTFRNKRYPLYSKDVSINMLNLINERL